MKWLFLFISLHHFLLADVLIFEDDFESGQLASPWTARPGTGGLVDADISFQERSLAISGFQGVALTRQSDGDLTTNALDLTLNLAGQGNVFLDFWINHVRQEARPENGIFLSVNGTSFTKIFDLDPALIENGPGHFPPLNLTALAAAKGLSLGPTTLIRFQQRGSADFSGCCSSDRDGFILDNVKVYREELVYQSLPFFDSFETGKLEPSWRWRRSDATAPASAHTPEGRVQVLEGIGAWLPASHGFYACVLGRRYDSSNDINNASALDLHLNLAGQTQVELQFSIAAVEDQQSPYDGIWFSDDGGNNFRKVFDFEPQAWIDATSKLPAIDLDKLAASAGLSLTSTFVIRFQQYGDSDFEGCCQGDRDGIVIDEVSVQVPLTQPIGLPFTESFEAELGPWWKVPDPKQTAGGLISGTAALAARLDQVQGVSVQRSGFFGLALGSSYRNDSGTVSAIDLYLNLAEYQQVDLRFWWNDVEDEKQAQDGIWFSGDSGATWTKVTQFEPAGSNQYRLVELDLDALAQTYRIPLNERFAIRFQQMGVDDFIGCCTSDRDGIFIDDLSITGSKTVASLPSRLVPHLTAANGGFTTSLVLSNPSPNALAYTLYPYTSAGEALPTVSGSVPAGQSTWTTPQSLFQDSRVSHFFISEQAPDVALAYSANGANSPAHLSEATAAYTSWRIFPGNWSQIFDGIAIVNAGNAAATVQIRQVRNDGQVLQNQVLVENLPVAAKTLFLLDSKFQPLPNCHFELHSGQPLGVTSLRGTRPGASSSFLWENKAIPLITP